MDPPMAARVTFLDPEEDAWECGLRSKRVLADLPTCLNIVKNIQVKELDRGVSRRIFGWLRREMTEEYRGQLTFGIKHMCGVQSSRVHFSGLWWATALASLFERIFTRVAGNAGFNTGRTRPLWVPFSLVSGMETGHGRSGVIEICRKIFQDLLSTYKAISGISGRTGLAMIERGEKLPGKVACKAACKAACKVAGIRFMNGDGNGPRRRWAGRAWAGGRACRCGPA